MALLLHAFTILQLSSVQPDVDRPYRLRLRAEHSVPLAKGMTAYLCGKAGSIIGDLPPYEAFPIGGTESVRGYSEGGVGTGRSYAAGTAELHFPLLKQLPFEVGLLAIGQTEQAFAPA